MGFSFQEFCKHQELTAELLADASYKLNICVDRESLPADKKRLPVDRLELKGSLQINSNTGICLPEVVKVGGDLILVGVGIKSLPRTLEVGGTLVLRATSVVEIHSGCSVGHLKVSGTPLRYMPIDWMVPGDVRFERCDFLVLPDGLSVGSLRLECCTVSELPSRLSVRDELDISGSFVSVVPSDCQCGSLTAKDSALVKLPDNLRINGSLDLSGSAIRVLPKGLYAGFLDISKTRIEEIPGDCEVEGLKASHSCLMRLPENWRVNGNVKLNDCMFLHELPKGLWVQGTLYICKTGIKEIPADCHLGNLDATSSALERLPDNWTVDGDVDLFGCKRMTELPQGLQVGGHLVIMRSNISRIPSDSRFHSLNARESCLKDLGGHTKVEGHLMLGQTKIKRLPERLEVGSDLELDGLNLDKLPDYLRVGGSMSYQFAKVDSFPKDGVVAGCVDCRGCHPRLVPEGFIAAATTYLKAEENRMFVFTRSGLEFHPNGKYCRYKDEVWRVEEKGKDFVRLKKLLSEGELVLKKDKLGRYKG